MTTTRILIGLGAAAGVWLISGLTALAVMQWQIDAPYRAAYRHYKATGQRLHPTTTPGNR